MSTDIHKTAWKVVIQKTKQETGDLGENKITEKITKAAIMNPKKLATTKIVETIEVPKER